MKEKYLDECKVIRQNCTYTAETHHTVALSAKRKAFWLEVVPAIIAAISSALVAAGFFSASVSAITAVLNPNKAYQDHLAAAKSFTALKHDARFLCNSQSVRLGDEALALAVENLHQRYNELLKSTPPTDSRSFERARKVVKAGLHDPDGDVHGSIK
jgi:hypothetical protein